VGSGRREGEAWEGVRRKEGGEDGGRMERKGRRRREEGLGLNEAGRRKRGGSITYAIFSPTLHNSPITRRKRRGRGGLNEAGRRKRGREHHTYAIFFSDLT
jgi:hypothetical protein